MSRLIDADTVDKTTNKSPDFRRANWEIYDEFLNDNIDLNSDFDSSIVTKSTIDAATEKITRLFLEVKELAIPYSVKKNSSFDVSPKTKTCIQNRNSLKRL